MVLCQYPFESIGELVAIEKVCASGVDNTANCNLHYSFHNFYSKIY